jgi:hypothetical protein
MIDNLDMHSASYEADVTAQVFVRIPDCHPLSADSTARSGLPTDPSY